MVILEAANVRKVKTRYSFVFEEGEIGVMWQHVKKFEVERIGERVRHYFAKLLHGPIIILAGLKHEDRPSAAARVKVENQTDLRKHRTVNKRSDSTESRFFSV